jgi:chorismate synthase
VGDGFGKVFRVTTFGESHGGALGVVIEGCPPGLLLDLAAVQAECDRRRPGQSALVSARKELDRVEVLSGLFEGRTLGTALTLVVRNKDADPRAYAPFKDLYRPSHADFTYEARYGHRAWAGGGRASARETVGRVAAGAVARQALATLAGVEIVGWVEQVGAIAMSADPGSITRDAVEASIVRCPEPALAEQMEALIRAVRKDGDSIGGIVGCVARGVPAGLGDPVFDKLEADLAKGMMSIPAAKGFESGSGFAGVAQRGSAHNDAFVPGPTPGSIRTRTNRSGGIQGGISNGMPITLRVAFKPVATIFQDQDTVNQRGEAATLRPRGRHDPCVVPRAVPIVEAMTAIVLLDHLLRFRAIPRSAVPSEPGQR